MSEPDLFVVCKNCSSEVSPYVTECPYCGQRVRKRAPKIERVTGALEGLPRRRRRARAPSLPKLRRGEIPGIAAETRPYVTGALIAAALIVSILVATNAVSRAQIGGIYGPVGHEWWRVAASPFIFANAGTEIVTLVAVAIFGTMIERRFGPIVVLAVFLIAGAAGAALAVELKATPALGANGAALGLLFFWLVDDRLAHHRGDDRGNDLIGVYVMAGLLLLLPVADTDSSFYAGLGGAAAGAVMGAALSPFRA